MPLDDLDLEFEDEEEAKKKKSEAVQVDVDLEFAAPEGTKRPPGKAVPQGAPASVQPVQRTAEIRKIDEARPQQPQIKKPAGSGTATMSISLPKTQGATALKEEVSLEVGSQEVLELRERVKQVEFEAEVKVAVAEFKTELLSELAGDIKLIEHQIGQLLVRINAKHPDMKQEVLMIKKILADFSAKKRK